MLTHVRHRPESHAKAKAFISCHADYRREHFMFPRTQSSALRDMPWENPHKTAAILGPRVIRLGRVAALAVPLFALLR